MGRRINNWKARIIKYQFLTDSFSVCLSTQGILQGMISSFHGGKRSRMIQREGPVKASFGRDSNSRKTRLPGTWTAWSLGSFLLVVAPDGRQPALEATQTGQGVSLVHAFPFSFFLLEMGVQRIVPMGGDGMGVDECV